MISAFILITLFGDTTPTFKLEPQHVLTWVDLTTKAPGCALLIDGIENDVNVAGSCEEVRKLLGLK